MWTLLDRVNNRIRNRPGIRRDDLCSLFPNEDDSSINGFIEELVRAKEVIEIHKRYSPWGDKKYAENQRQTN